MNKDQNIKVALVRGNSLNNWEGKLWEDLENIAVTGFCTNKNLYQFNLAFPVKRMYSTADNFITRQVDKFLRARFLAMPGLESELDQFDIVHTAELSYWYTNQAVRAKKSNPNLRVVVTIWDNSFGRFEYNYWPWFKKVPAWWRKLITRSIVENVNGVDLFLPVTQSAKDMLMDYGVAEERIKVLTPAVIQPRDNNLNPDFLKNHNLEGKDIYMVVNRMIKEKGIYDILYAWRMYCLENKNHKAILLMIGAGRERENAMRMVNDWGLNDYFCFIETLPNDQVRNLFSYAKVLILASLPGPLWQEQFGFVLAEAISCGCPVISTYSGAIPEVIENAGILFSPGNPSDLYMAIKKINNQDVYFELKNNCKRVQEKFGPALFRENLINIYCNLVAN
ncbi:MAG: glycosyltransferase family 4 protein [bacterium]